MLSEKQRRKMRVGQPGPQPAKSAGPTAKLRASGPRARSKSRPASNISCIISYIGDRKIIGTQDSLGHRFWLAVPIIWAQIRPWL